ncbi:glycosyltransferase family A protein [Arthrobacter sp. JCM 19049]|uniref:glycosyltransferase family A protein n=1 Tax=Arthrobacter sp. JCM 19049 TaxID=1460643 RepID=UPI00279569DC|nr:glycosyltransferase family A protein [Arthrobacter sp. JCM 19049]
MGNGWDPERIPASIRTLFLPENLGIPAGRNAGVPMVSGEFLCFLDDDSWFLEDNFLTSAIERFRLHPGMGLLQLESPTQNVTMILHVGFRA